MHVSESDSQRAPPMTVGNGTGVRKIQNCNEKMLSISFSLKTSCQWQVLQVILLTFLHFPRKESNQNPEEPFPLIIIQSRKIRVVQDMDCNSSSGNTTQFFPSKPQLLAILAPHRSWPSPSQEELPIAEENFLIRGHAPHRAACSLLQGYQVSVPKTGLF